MASSLPALPPPRILPDSLVELAAPSAAVIRTPELWQKHSRQHGRHQAAEPSTQHKFCRSLCPGAARDGTPQNFFYSSINPVAPLMPPGSLIMSTLCISRVLFRFSVVMTEGFFFTSAEPAAGFPLTLCSPFPLLLLQLFCTWLEHFLTHSNILSTFTFFLVTLYFTENVKQNYHLQAHLYFHAQHHCWYLSNLMFCNRKQSENHKDIRPLTLLTLEPTHPPPPSHALISYCYLNTHTSALFLNIILTLRLAVNTTPLRLHSISVVWPPCVPGLRQHSQRHLN